MNILIGVIIVTMLIIHFLPKLTRAIPAPLVAIAVCTAAVFFIPTLKNNTQTVDSIVNQQRLLAAQRKAKTVEFKAEKNDKKVGEVVAFGKTIAAAKSTVDEKSIVKGLKASLPKFAIPSIKWDFHSIKVIFLLALTLASIGLIESLMTLTLIDELTETRGQGNRECFGQGFANLITGFFGGMGGCAMIGQSMININSGGRGRSSGISAALFLLAFILFIPGLIGIIPIAALIGVMFMVVIATFEWSSLRLFGKVPKSDIFVIIAVSTVTVIMDLAIAVGVGIVISALVYAWNSAKHLTLKTAESKDENEKIYELNGNIFFGSTTSFKDLFEPKDDPAVVILDFKNSKVCDHSGIEAIHGLSEKYKSLDKKLVLKHLSSECSTLLKNAGDIVEVNMMEDPKYHLAEDSLA
jgi:SulP family sulfate permease